MVVGAGPLPPGAVGESPASGRPDGRGGRGVLLVQARGSAPASTPAAETPTLPTGRSPRGLTAILGTRSSVVW